MSGGQQQRVGIAMAFSCRPRVIVLDEPTTGLDVTTQRRVLDTVRELTAEHNVTSVYVSHDLAVVAQLADADCGSLRRPSRRARRNRGDLPRRAPPLHRGPAQGGAQLGAQRDPRGHRRQAAPAGPMAAGLLVRRPVRVGGRAVSPGTRRYCAISVTPNPTRCGAFGRSRRCRSSTPKSRCQPCPGIPRRY